jgi:hypothetical protein
MDINCQTVS